MRGTHRQRACLGKVSGVKKNELLQRTPSRHRWHCWEAMKGNQESVVKPQGQQLWAMELPPSPGPKRQRGNHQRTVIMALALATHHHHTTGARASVEELEAGWRRRLACKYPSYFLCLPQIPNGVFQWPHPTRMQRALLSQSTEVSLPGPTGWRNGKGIQKSRWRIPCTSRLGS